MASWLVAELTKVDYRTGAHDLISVTMLVSIRQPRKNIPVQLLGSYSANSVSLEMGACGSERWTGARADYEMELLEPSGERIQKFLSDRTRYSGVNSITLKAEHWVQMVDKWVLLIVLLILP